MYNLKCKKFKLKTIKHIWAFVANNVVGLRALVPDLSDAHLYYETI